MGKELSEKLVQSALTTSWIGRNFQYYQSIGSTNSTLKEMVSAGDKKNPPAGTVLLTDFQSRGRGRLDRQWIAGAGTSLLLSILFRPNWPPQHSFWLTMIGSLAAAEAMEAASGLQVKVKWPNDLVISVKGTWHKVSGILLEADIGEQGRVETAILGIGMNVNIPLEQLPEGITPAISLMVGSGSTIPRLTLLADFLQRVEHLYQAAENGRSPQPLWKQRLVTLGQQVEVTDASGAESIKGTAEDTDDWGLLLVRDDQGTLHKVSAGDVTLRGRSAA